MSDVALRMEGVYKRFRKGAQYDSLRDLIPALTGRMFKRTELRDDDSKDFWALQDVSFDVKEGEAFGIVGHNGAGKSTILKVLSGIMRPTKGSLVVNGRLSAVLEVSAGFHPDLTGRENIFLNGTIFGMSRREIESKLDAIIEFSGLKDFIDTPVKRYSSGMFARLGFSVCTHVDPDILIVDEVLSVGDVMFQKKCFDRMLKVMQSGTTVLFVSHNLKAVSELCDRSLLLDHGRVLEVGETDSIIRRYTEIAQTRSGSQKDLDAYVADILIDGAPFAGQEFDVGQKVRVAVKIRANRDMENLAVALLITDQHYYEIFNTSSERLSGKSFNLKAGEELVCEMELSMFMAFGLYHFGVALHRYTDDKTIDQRRPAFSFYVGKTTYDYLGIIPASPKLLAMDIGPARS